jgi:hypothetical protein
VVSDEVDQIAIEPEEARVIGFAQGACSCSDRVEDWLDGGGRTRDDPQDLARCRLLIEGHRQAFLKIAGPRAPVLQQLAGDRELAFYLRFRRLCTPRHLPLPASQGPYDRTTINDRLGEGARIRKR